MSHQLSYQEDVRLKDKKGRLNEIGKRGVERERGGRAGRGLEMCRWLKTVGG